MLSRILTQEEGQTVTYRRGSYSAPFTAGIGQTEKWGSDSGDTHDRIERRDFLIRAEDLILNGSATTPADGDLITDAAGEWVVMTIEGGSPDPWEFSDESRSVYRVHAWQGRP